MIDPLFARTRAPITWRMVFSFFNESKGVLVVEKLVIWVFLQNTFEMSRITAICTVIEPMLWVSFFFTNITIVFTRIIFSSITKSEVMLMLFVSCGKW